jgi:tRNA(Ile)-lysidine synthetase, N-terminal domain
MKITLNKNEKYILACSFGPDSMCLFALLLKGHYDFMVAHVNYHLRVEEPKEVLILKEICEKNKIPLDIIDVYMPEKVNEEGWARNVRYDYFASVSKKYHIDNVLIAHNEDDLIETYLLQKKRHNVVAYYGLRKESIYKGAKILRPLLKNTKKELLQYCDENSIPYGFDLSNFDVAYARNKIRKEVVKEMPREKRDALLCEIEKKNSDNEELILNVSKFIVNREINAKEVKSLNNKETQMLLIQYFESENYYQPISFKFASEFKNIINKKTTWHHKFDDLTYLALDYGTIKLYRLINNKFSDDELNKIFFINKKANFFKNISDKNLSIKINLKSNEIYLLNGISKRVGRCFIDWKVPYVLRLLWPGIYNEEGKLIYIPRYKKDFIITEDSVLIFDISKFLK